MRESVMHFEVDRHLADAELAELDRRASARVLARRPGDRRATSPTMKAAGPAMIEAARGGQRRATRRRDRGGAGLPRVARWTATSSSSATASTTFARAGVCASSRARASGSSPRTTRVALSRSRCRSRRSTRGLRERLLGGRRCSSSRRRTASRPSTGTREDGRHHGQARRRSAASIVGALRLLGLFTSQGVHGAGRAATPILAPQAPPDRRRRGLPRGLARLQAARRAVRVVPEGRALRRAASTSCARRSSRCSTSRSAASVQLFVRRDLDERRVAVLVALPRDRFNAELRQRLQELFLRALRRHLDRLPPVPRRDRAGADPLHRPRRRARSPRSRFAELEQEVVALTRTWDDRLRERLVALHGEERGHVARRRRTRRCFPDYYKASTDIYLALLDIEQFERLEAGEAVRGRAPERAGARARA